MRRMSYQRVYQCNKCGYIQSDSNLGVCKKCGSECPSPAVGRWIDTSTLWQIFTLTSSGYWELKDAN